VILSFVPAILEVTTSEARATREASHGEDYVSGRRGVALIFTHSHLEVHLAIMVLLEEQSDDRTFGGAKRRQNIGGAKRR
jgi:hypothetical protein